MDNDSEDETREIVEIFNFSQLPWAIFLTILEFFKLTELSQLCLVNKMWCKACRDPSLWRSVDLIKYENVSDEDLYRITSFSNNVLTLKISKRLTDTGVICVIKQCTSLVELTMTHCELSDQVLEAVGEYCWCLRKLDISLSLNFSDDGLKKVNISHQGGTGAQASLSLGICGGRRISRIWGDNVLLLSRLKYYMMIFY